MASDAPAETDFESEISSDTEIDTTAPSRGCCRPLLKGLRNLLWQIPLAIVCCPCLVCCFFGCGEHRKLTPAKIKLARRKKGSASPKPLPLRRRALSIPKGDAPVFRSAQQEVLFFTKLPWDIRYMIYEHVVRPSRWDYVHVASTHKRVCSFECSATPGKPHLMHQCWGTDAVDGTSIRTNRRRQDKVLGMLCSCHRMYSEAVDLLYTSNTLHVCLTRTILDMQKCMLPHRFQRIRSLYLEFPLHHYFMNPRSQDRTWPGSVITFWKPAWSVIADMRGLVKLTVLISSRMYFDHTVDRRTVTQLLKPMMAVKHIRDFALETSLPLSDGVLENVLQKLGGDPPFTIRWKNLIDLHLKGYHPEGTP